MGTGSVDRSTWPWRLVVPTVPVPNGTVVFQMMLWAQIPP